MMLSCNFCKPGHDSESFTAGQDVETPTGRGQVVGWVPCGPAVPVYDLETGMCGMGQLLSVKVRMTDGEHRILPACMIRYAVDA
jgi:hypothetical protein